LLFLLIDFLISERINIWWRKLNLFKKWWNMLPAYCFV
jgi:hypothetical protein